MKNTTKKLLGYAGLALVAAITAVAVAIPPSDANAESAETDVNVQITVNRRQEAPTVRIERPLDGSEFTNPDVTSGIYYGNVVKVEYALEYTDPSGNTVTDTLPEYNPASPTGTRDFNLDLSQYGYGTFVLRVTVLGINGTTEEDAVQFAYNPIGATNGGSDEDTGEPIVKVDFDNTVCSIHFQAYNKLTNAALFDPEFVYTLPDPRPSTNQVSVKLPFKEHNAVAGDYRVVATAYTCGDPSDPTDPGQPIYPSAIIDVHYEPVEEEFTVPNTGGGLFAGLNLSRSDYLATGALVFGFALILAFIVLAKRKKSTKR